MQRQISEKKFNRKKAALILTKSNEAINSQIHFKKNQRLAYTS